MQQHCDVLKQANNTPLTPPGQSRQRRLLFFLAVAVPLLALIACTLGRPQAWLTRGPDVARLPTLTRTPLPTLTPTINPTALAATAAAVPTASPPPPAAPPAPVAVPPTPAEAVAAQVAAVAPTALPLTNPPTAAAPPPPTDTPTAAPTPTDTPPPAPTATPLPGGWVFADVRLSSVPDGDNQLILGNLINNTGLTQSLDTIDGLFYDNQGQMIDNAFYTYDYPVNEVPQGGQMPFQIAVKARPHAADVKLEVLAESSGEAPRQDFEFLEVNAGPQGNEYCVAGKVRNPGSELGRYLVIAAVLYDGQNKVINYNYDDYDEALPVLAGEQTQDVTICVDPLQQEVARYELAAWGL